jgi:antitoxin (DNA-binding transcriptional repressor) of toxin-antitoxin stability system
VCEGRSYTITSEGRPVARITAIEHTDEQLSGDREAAKQRLLARLRSQPAINAGKWTRDELYER